MHWVDVVVFSRAPGFLCSLEMVLKHLVFLCLVITRVVVFAHGRAHEVTSLFVTHALTTLSHQSIDLPTK